MCRVHSKLGTTWAEKQIVAVSHPASATIEANDAVLHTERGVNIYAASFETEDGRWITTTICLQHNFVVFYMQTCTDFHVTRELPGHWISNFLQSYIKERSLDHKLTSDCSWEK